MKNTKKTYILSRFTKILLYCFITTCISLYIYSYRLIFIEQVPIYATMKKNNFSQYTVGILPFEDSNIEEIILLSHLFSELYGIKTEVIATEKLPKNAFIRKTNQYDLNKLNSYLVDVKKGKKYFRLLGITEQDVTCGDFDYLLGMASLSQEVAMISTKRLREKFYKRSKNDLLFRTRFFKLVLHEYAHTFYLMHCNNNCLMQFTPIIENFDNKPLGLCWICRRNIQISE